MRAGEVMREVFMSRGMALAFFVAALLTVGSCQSDRGAPGVEAADASVTTASPGAGANGIAESADTRDRVAELRARFLLRVAEPPSQGGIPGSSHATQPQTEPPPVIAEGVARGFELREGYARAVIPAEAKRGVALSHRASVALPMRAGDPVKLEDDASRVAVSFALRGASDAAIATTGGIAMYARALGGADVVHRVHAEGTEDFVVFESKPEREEIAYDVDVSRVAGLRFVSSTLEFLDEGGTPRLRVAPPYVVGADGARREAMLAVDGCAYDTSGVGPWGRAVTKPGAARCGVRVAWGGAGDAAVVYPAIVDPTWTATGSMATARRFHTATLLPSGKVLVAGGANSTVSLSSAELYDPTGAGSFAATGAMATARRSHTATLLASGKVLVAGGAPDGVAVNSSAELFDPTGTGSFAPTASMAIARAYHQATLLTTGKVLITGGSSDGTAAVSSAQLFDPTGAGSFAATGAMATARHGHTATLLASGKVLVAGGTPDNVAVLSSAELFDPTGAGSFAATGALATARRGHTATLLPSGKVLVAAGEVAGGAVLASAELFDPSGAAGAGAFVATGAMATARRRHTATLLASGKEVLIAGGQDGSNVTLSSAELFDPTGAGSFAATAAMATARDRPTATLLTSGKVLVAGGRNGGYLSSAELFGGHAAGGTCGSAAECLSHVCEDGVCCAGPCSGTCMTCTADTGACVAVTSADDPDTCTATRTCDPSGACKLKVDQPCVLDSDCTMDAFCKSGLCSKKLANGAPCTANGQCTTGTGCVNGVCTSASTCDPDGHTVRDSANNPKDCAPYVCAGGACATTCTSVVDCAYPNVCGTDGRCIPPPSAPTGESGGCSAAASRTTKDASPSLFALAVLALALAARRRRAERSSVMNPRRR